LKYLPTPGLEVKDLFFEVGREVVNATSGRQQGNRVKKRVTT